MICGWSLLMMRVLVLLAIAVLQTGARPQFEVASVKSCGPADPGFRGGGPTQFAPDAAPFISQFLGGWFSTPYTARRDGGTDQTAVLRTPIEGGPDWISEERYAINAKAPTEMPEAMMVGPMLQ